MINKNKTEFSENDENISFENILTELDNDLAAMGSITISDSEEYSEEEMEMFKMKERERVFSGDLYQKINTIIFYLNFIEAHEGTIHEKDAWKPCIEFFTLMEARELCDSVCSPKKREQIGELEGGYFCGEIQRHSDIPRAFDWLYGHMETHQHFLHKSREFLVHRNREF